MSVTKIYKPTSLEKKSLERARKNLAKGENITLSELKRLGSSEITSRMIKKMKKTKKLNRSEFVSI
ncbi:MAG: hypothetical protein ISR98_01135 [Parcubacteria group bacterium]|nr:hypothetical protein [Parcubacteria group bacterium]